MISEGDALVSPQQAPLALLHRVLWHHRFQG